MNIPMKASFTITIKYSTMVGGGTIKVLATNGKIAAVDTNASESFIVFDMIIEENSGATIVSAKNLTIMSRYIWKKTTKLSTITNPFINLLSC